MHLWILPICAHACIDQQQKKKRGQLLKKTDSYGRSAIFFRSPGIVLSDNTPLKWRHFCNCILNINLVEHEVKKNRAAGQKN